MGCRFLSLSIFLLFCSSCLVVSGGKVRDYTETPIGCSTRDTSCPPLDFTGKRNIVQLGEPRSASTYQYQVLCVAAKLKFGTKNVSCHYLTFDRDRYYHVVKTHSNRNMARPDILFVSTRSGIIPTPKPINFLQNFEDLLLLGDSGLKLYRDLFALTEEQYLTLHQYIHYWQIFRKCCNGPQSSAAWYKEITGGELVQSRTHFLYNDCGLYDLDKLEERLRKTEICQGPDGQDVEICPYVGQCQKSMHEIIEKGEQKRERLRLLELKREQQEQKNEEEGD